MRKVLYAIRTRTPPACHGKPPECHNITDRALLVTQIGLFWSHGDMWPKERSVSWAKPCMPWETSCVSWETSYVWPKEPYLWCGDTLYVTRTATRTHTLSHTHIESCSVYIWHSTCAEDNHTHTHSLSHTHSLKHTLSHFVYTSDTLYVTRTATHAHTLSHTHIESRRVYNLTPYMCRGHTSETPYMWPKEPSLWCDDTLYVPRTATHAHTLSLSHTLSNIHWVISCIRSICAEDIHLKPLICDQKSLLCDVMTLYTWRGQQHTHTHSLSHTQYLSHTHTESYRVYIWHSTCAENSHIWGPNGPFMRSKEPCMWSKEPCMWWICDQKSRICGKRIPRSNNASAKSAKRGSCVLNRTL